MDSLADALTEEIAVAHAAETERPRALRRVSKGVVD